jgi:hypothetical protein
LLYIKSSMSIAFVINKFWEYSVMSWLLLVANVF